MRDIIFRGKDFIGNWHFGLLAHIGNAWCISNKAGIATAFEVIPETVGQYTGLTDKNGRKIFEVDLCLCDRNISKHIDKKVFEIKFNPGTGFFGESNTPNIYTSGFYMCEIIGNAYDNPELLKAGEIP